MSSRRRRHADTAGHSFRGNGTWTAHTRDWGDSSYSEPPERLIEERNRKIRSIEETKGPGDSQAGFQYAALSSARLAAGDYAAAQGAAASSSITARNRLLRVPGSTLSPQLAASVTQSR